MLPHFREATWDEALDLVAARLREIHAESGPAGIAGFGSAKCSNEEAYLFQKLIRTGFRTNNVDHCTRLCHASSVAALFEGIGSGAVSTTYGDVVNADVAIVAGSNATANHPVASSFFKQARRQRHDDHLRRPAGRHGSPTTPTSSASSSPAPTSRSTTAIMHEVIRLGLVDEEYVAARTSNYDALAEHGRRLPARARRADHGGLRRRDPPGGAASGARPAPGSSSGAWASPSTRPAPTTPAA